MFVLFAFRRFSRERAVFYKKKFGSPKKLKFQVQLKSVFATQVATVGYTAGSIPELAEVGRNLVETLYCSANSPSACSFDECARLTCAGDQVYSWHPEDGCTLAGGLTPLGSVLACPFQLLKTDAGCSGGDLRLF